MPQRIAVKDLYTLATECLSKYLVDVAFEMENDLNGVNKYFINNIPPKVMSDVLFHIQKVLVPCRINGPTVTKLQRAYSMSQYCAFDFKSWFENESRRTNFRKWIAILNAVLVKGTYELLTLWIYDDTEDEFLKLVRTKSYRNSTFINHPMYFEHDSERDNEDEQSFYTTFNTIKASLQESFASKLNKLVLTSVSNNSVLKAIGENAHFLKHLNIHESRTVDDNGIKNLLINDESFLEMRTPSANQKLCHRLILGDISILNPVCFSLEKLWIEGTQTTGTDLIMILTCIQRLKCLKHFGDIGKALKTIYCFSLKPRVFQLTELIDSKLCMNNLKVFEECLPYVKKLNTQLSANFSPMLLVYPEQKSVFWSNIETLIIGVYSTESNTRLVQLLNFCGRYLLHLNIKNQLGRTIEIDLAKLLKHCPNLESLIVSNLMIIDTLEGQFTKLKSINLINTNFDTMIWLVYNCPCLEEATIDAKSDMRLRLIIDNPPLIVLNNLKRLDITFSANVLITYDTVTQFIEKCSNLQFLGSLQSWNSTDDEIAERVLAYVKEMIYELKVY